MSLEFLLTSLLVVLIPGTGVIYTLSMGLFTGARASIYAALGCTLGIVPHLLASIAGLAAVLHASAVAFQVVKVLGVLYLFYLAWGMWQDSGRMALAEGEEASSANGWKIAVRGALINVLNPKLSIFFLAFLPQFISPAAASPMLDMLLLGGVFMAMTFAVFVVYGFCAAFVGKRLFRSDRVLTWMRRTVAAAFAGFGLRLAFLER